MTDYEYTQDWFHWAPPIWKQLIPMLPENPTCLEIGSFEGRSMVWIAQNMLGERGSLTCIDTWLGGEDHQNDELKGAEERFDRNRRRVMEEKGWDVDKQYGEKSIGVVKSSSKGALASMFVDNEDDTFDFIYIDGSHTAPDVLTDAILAWPLLKEKGILVFDDYAWGNTRDILHRPKLAIDAFTNIFAEQMEIIHIGQQAVVRKRSVPAAK